MLSGLIRRFTESMTLTRVNFLIAFTTLLVIVLIRVTVAPATATGVETCEVPVDTVTTGVDELAVLIPREGELLNYRWVFDADDTVKRVSSVLDWKSPPVRPASLEVGDQLAVRLPRDLSNEDDDESIPRDQITAKAVVTGNGVELTICVDTSGSSPDRYTSAVSFVDKEITAVPFTIDVTVKHRQEWIPLAAIIGGLALALMLLVYSASDDPASKPAKLAVFAVFAILSTAVVARPWAAWQDNPTWGKDRFDFVTLFAATALAFAGAMSIPDALRARRNATDSDADGSPAVAATPPASEPPGSEPPDEPAHEPAGEETL